MNFSSASTPEFQAAFKLSPSDRLTNLKKLNLYSKNTNNFDKTRNESPSKMLKSFNEHQETEDKYLLALKKEKNDNDASNAKKTDLKLPVSTNQRKQINQNSVEGRKFLIFSSNLEKQLIITQNQIKRNKTLLLDQYLEAKAVNFSTVTNRKNLESNLTGSYSQFTDRNLTTSLDERSITDRSNNIFSQSHDNFNKYYKFNELKPNDVSKPYRSYLDSITDKFVDQKRTCYPSYLKKGNISSQYTSFGSYDAQKFTERVKNINELNKRTCTKYRNHKIAEYHAENYNQSKHLVKEFPGLNDLFNNALNENKTELENPNETNAEDKAIVDEINATNDSKENEPKKFVILP